MKKIEENQKLGNNQTGGRKKMSVIETVIFNEMITETHSFTKILMYSRRRCNRLLCQNHKNLLNHKQSQVWHT